MLNPEPTARGPLRTERVACHISTLPLSKLNSTVEGTRKWRTIAVFRALDGTMFTDVDTQNPATEVLFNELSAQAAFDDESLLEAAYEAILFQPTDGTATAAPPTQFKVYLTPLEVHGRWRIRCGKLTSLMRLRPLQKQKPSNLALYLPQTKTLSQLLSLQLHPPTPTRSP